MTLFGAIQTYIDMRRAHGVLFDRGSEILRSLSRKVGDIPIEAIRPTQILEFLNGRRTSTDTWRRNFSLLRAFFEHWSLRGVLDQSPMPPTRPPAARNLLPYVPYVYTLNEVRLLLRTTSSWRTSSWQALKISRMDSRTFHILLLTLYATGMRTGEARSLLRKDVDVNRGMITIRGGRYTRSRTIPIGADLQAKLRRHKRGVCIAPGESLCFFAGKDGKPLNKVSLNVAFRNLRRLARIERHDGAIYQPRMHDLRATFAVHRLTSWLRQGADLNRLLPALAAYMGQCGLGSTERYLKLTPERFRNQLVRLSPQSAKKKRWRDDPALMKFLDNL